MKAITFEFVGGPWEGQTLRTDSSDQEEAWLAAACYETSHHGAIGERCVEFACDAAGFARRHGWLGIEEGSLRGGRRYSVAVRRETKTEIVVTFEFEPTPDV